jgi:hypothetical protein
MKQKIKYLLKKKQKINSINYTMSAFISNVLLQLICQPNASVKFLTNPKLDFK